MSKLSLGYSEVKALLDENEETLFAIAGYYDLEYSELCDMIVNQIEENDMTIEAGGFAISLMLTSIQQGEEFTSLLGFIKEYIEESLRVCA